MADDVNEERANENSCDGAGDAEEALSNLLARAVGTHERDERGDHCPIEAIAGDLNAENDCAADGDAHLDRDAGVRREPNSVYPAGAPFARGDGAHLRRSRQPSIEKGHGGLKCLRTRIGTSELPPLRPCLDEGEDRSCEPTRHDGRRFVRRVSHGLVAEQIVNSASA